jgi:5-formyltetrahydrofolate cyclo-ligase
MTASPAPAFWPSRHASKQDIRRELRERRAARAHDRAEADGEEVALARTFLAAVPAVAADPASALPSVRRAVVAVYLSRTGEPGTGALRATLAGRGGRVLLPWLRDDRDLDWVTDPGPAVLRGAPMQPPGERLGREAVHDADVVLVPALAVDTAGRRLGQGGGSYDRVLARLSGVAPADRPLVVACVHDDEVLDARRHPLPEEPHDRRVDAVLTPTRWTVTASGGG